MQSLIDLGYEPSDEDKPPPLEWEQHVLDIYFKCQNAVGTDYNLVTYLANRHNYDIDLTLELISEISNEHQKNKNSH